MGLQVNASVNLLCGIADLVIAESACNFPRCPSHMSVLPTSNFKKAQIHLKNVCLLVSDCCQQSTDSKGWKPSGNDDES